MTNKKIDYDKWRVRSPRNLDIGEYWSKEAHVHTVISKLEVGAGFEFEFSNIRTLRKIVHTTNMYLESDAHPDRKEDNNRRYDQEVNEARLTYSVKRTK